MFVQAITKLLKLVKMEKNFLYTENKFRYVLVPPVFILFFTNIVQYLAIIGQGRSFTFSEAYLNHLGNYTAWQYVLCVVLWGYLSLILSSAKMVGPVTPGGYQPVYKDNGVLFFWVTMVVFLAKQTVYPNYRDIYYNMPQILGALQTVAMIFCSLLVVKGKLLPECKADILPARSIIYEFYRGVELHPRLLGVNVKQLTNCRVGMITWQIFITSNFLTGLEEHGFNMAAFVNWTLQTIYIAKFFYWESGYFYTLDMMLDRAGYYICWGCLVWVPCLYTYSSYYIVEHVPGVGTFTAMLLAVIGLTSVLMNYLVDLEKQLFRQSPGYKCNLWGRTARYILAKYQDATGTVRETALLTSGFWGIARHMNYTFELVAAFCWCACGLSSGFTGLLPLLYFAFIFILLTHRTVRDENKCEEKYGVYWRQYCEKVPYRLVPYVW